MNCQECLPALELYLDGELGEQRRDLVQTHLSACPSCAGAYESLVREQELFLSYEVDATPSPSFWDETQARIRREASPPPVAPLVRVVRRLFVTFDVFNAPRFSPTLTVALLLAAIVITVGVMRQLTSNREKLNSVSVVQNAGSAVIPPTVRDQAEITTTPSPVESKASNQTTKAGGEVRQPPGGNLNRAERNRRGALPARAEVAERTPRNLIARHGRQQPATPEELVREAEQKYMAAVALLSRDVNRRRSRLAPETAARFRQTLASIDRTIADTSRAVREHPSDPVAAQYMLLAYAKKVEILRQMASY
ncbi:MAG: anti-sigma factor family protein [Pyrinomonadaceae bacterium]